MHSGWRFIHIQIHVHVDSLPVRKVAERGGMIIWNKEEPDALATHPREVAECIGLSIAPKKDTPKRILVAVHVKKKD